MVRKIKYVLLGITCISILSKGQCAEDRYEQILAVVNQHSQQITTLNEEKEELRRQLSEVVNSLTNHVNFTNALVPIGSIMEYSGTAAVPNNWLECDGRAISRTNYQELLRAIGITYGAGDQLNTFNIPDRRGRVGVGIGSNNSTGGHVTNATAHDIALGKKFGEERHTLTINEMPSHHHDFSACKEVQSDKTDPLVLAVTGAKMWDIRPTSSGGNHPHNNMQPSMFVKIYIRAK